jgi:hypothetical protein
MQSMKKRVFTRPLTVVVSDDVCRELNQLTRETDCSLSEWIREAIDLKLEELSKTQNRNER